MSGARIEIACELRRETESAYLIHDGDRQAWIPKSQCSTFEPSKPGSKCGTLDVEEWLAHEKGLI